MTFCQSIRLRAHSRSMHSSASLGPGWWEVWSGEHLPEDGEAEGTDGGLAGLGHAFRNLPEVLKVRLVEGILTEPGDEPPRVNLAGGREDETRDNFLGHGRPQEQASIRRDGPGTGRAASCRWVSPAAGREGLASRDSTLRRTQGAAGWHATWSRENSTREKWGADRRRWEPPSGSPASRPDGRQEPLVRQSPDGPGEAFVLDHHDVLGEVGEAVEDGVHEGVHVSHLFFLIHSAKLQIAGGLRLRRTG